MLLLVLFIIILIICFLDLLTMGYIHNLFLKFFIALPLFFKDIIRRDKEVFRGYGFWAFCGLGGSGKTISIVDYLIRMRQLYPKVLILTNFFCTVADGKINNWRDLLVVENLETIEIEEKEFLKRKKWGQTHIYSDFDTEGVLHYYKKINNGVIFGFDEIHLTFESTKWQDAPENLLDYISQQRKLHKQIVSSSQVFTRIDKKLREQTNYVVECRSLLGGRLVTNKYFNTPEYIANDEKFDKGSRKRKPFKRYVFIATDSIRNAYNTEEILKELETNRSDVQKLSNLIKKFREGEIV